MAALCQTPACLVELVGVSLSFSLTADSNERRCGVGVRERTTFKCLPSTQAVVLTSAAVCTAQCNVAGHLNWSIIVVSFFSFHCVAALFSSLTQ